MHLIAQTSEICEEKEYFSFSIVQFSNCFSNFVYGHSCIFAPCSLFHHFSSSRTKFLHWLLEFLVEFDPSTHTIRWLIRIDFRFYVLLIPAHRNFEHIAISCCGTVRLLLSSRSARCTCTTEPVAKKILHFRTMSYFPFINDRSINDNPNLTNIKACK